jgi:hypothetical protein
MKIGSGRVLDRLPREEPCLGAVFTSYSFDPGFFEDHVLRAVLRLASDPIEQGARYHSEARTALQESPVAVFVDAAERRPGRRLPYDLLEVSDLVFHPKSVLLLYKDQARFMVGSGNLTFSGYGGNTELFISLDLRYDTPADASLLREFDFHLSRIALLARQSGTQLALFRQELARRVGNVTAESSLSNVALLDSTTAPIIEQLEALLPKNAIIEGLGTLAPFYERDDDCELDVTSVFGVLKHRMSTTAVLDVGVAWDNPQVYPDGEIFPLKEGLGRLWAWAQDGDAGRVVEYLVPTSIGPNTLGYSDQLGNGRRWPINEVDAALQERFLWMLPQPIAFAPQKTLEAAKSQFSDVRIWLHPATRLLEGRPVHRPLHAKILLINFLAGSARGTLVVIGSANMSRRALLFKAGPAQGNVELALAFRLNGSSTLIDFVPELVFAPTSALKLQEREFPDVARNYSLMIEHAVHDPTQRTLAITWANDAKDVLRWRLTYCGNEIARSSALCTTSLVIKDFVLQPASAELVLHVDGREFSIPILVTDLIALPAMAAGTGIGLNELLMLLGRRIGAERAIQITERTIAAGEDLDALAAFFGEGFGPTDVFRAWWAVAEDLRDPALSVSAFRLRLEGTMGVGAAWARMHDATAVEHSLAPSEVWFYGAELLRELGEIELSPDVDRMAKEDVLAAFMKRIRVDLDRLNIDELKRPWMQKIQAFYREPIHD